MKRKIIYLRTYLFMKASGVARVWTYGDLPDDAVLGSTYVREEQIGIWAFYEKLLGEWNIVDLKAR